MACADGSLTLNRPEKNPDLFLGFLSGVRGDIDEAVVEGDLKPSGLSPSEAGSLGDVRQSDGDGEVACVKMVCPETSVDTVWIESASDDFVR